MVTSQPAALQIQAPMTSIFQTFCGWPANTIPAPSSNKTGTEPKRPRTDPKQNRSDPEQTPSRIEAPALEHICGRASGSSRTFQFPHLLAGASLSRLVPETWPKTFVTASGFQKNGPGAEASQDMWDFPSPWPRPHFPVSCSEFSREHLLPHTFWKKRARAPQLVCTCSILLAYGRDLTFPHWVPSLIEVFCHHTRF